MEKARELVQGKGRSQELRWSERRCREKEMRGLAAALETESDGDVQVLARVTLAGERRIAVARAFGYADGSAVTHALKRIERRAEGNAAFRRRLE